MNVFASRRWARGDGRCHEDSTRHVRWRNLRRAYANASAITKLIIRQDRDRRTLEVTTICLGIGDIVLQDGTRVIWYHGQESYSRRVNGRVR